MKNLKPEMIEKAKAAKSAEELLALAKENNVEMTADEAATYFAQLNPKSGELDDDDLDAVAGGANGGCNNSEDRQCPDCGATLKSMVGTDDTMKFECSTCNKEFVAYASEGFSMLHPVKKMNKAEVKVNAQYIPTFN
jgi:NADH pyrophosphatase NudC (nudix superfamily)